jgi:hypothetical protein
MEQTNNVVNNQNMPTNPIINNPMDKSFQAQEGNFMNMGMRQANNNIGNINNPGSGNIYDPGDFSGEGTPIGDQGISPGAGQNLIDPGQSSGNEQVIDPVGFTNESYWDIFNLLPSQLQNQINSEGGMLSLDSNNSLMNELINNYWSDSGWDMGGIQNYIVHFNENFQDITDIDLGGLNIGGAFDWDFGGMTDQIGQNLYDSRNKYQNQIETPQQFAGGGGQGGQQAKQLYYPGTSGGFAGVGSGIGGVSTLDELLKKMKS